MMRDRARRAFARAFAIAAPLTLILAFQNCTSGKSAVIGTGTNNKSAQTDNGNGNGYGGMQYFVTRSATSICADGTDVRSRIAVTRAQNTYLVRENCKDIAPTRVNVSYTASSDVPSLAYGSDVFHGEQGLPAPTNANTVPQAMPSPSRNVASTTLDISRSFECSATELGRTDSKATISLNRRPMQSEGGRIYSHKGSLKVQTAGSIREFENFRVERLAPLVLISEGSGRMSSLLVTLNGEQLPSSGVLNFSVDGRTKTFQITGCQ